MDLKWEFVAWEGTEKAWRTKTFGGWLLMLYTWDGDREHLVFIPDAMHQWDLDNKDD